MRKLLIFAALIVAAAGATAHADDRNKVVAAPAAPVPEYLDKSSIHIVNSALTTLNGICYLDIDFEVMGQQLHVMGRLTGQNYGGMFIPNPVSQVPDTANWVGYFVDIGDVRDSAILIELKNPANRAQSLLGVFIKTQNHSGLDLSSDKFFFTDGFRLKNRANDIRSAGLSSNEVTYRFDQKQNADLFFNWLESRFSPRDVKARPVDCVGDCGNTYPQSTVPGVLVPGVVAPRLGYGMGRTDNSLRN